MKMFFSKSTNGFYSHEFHGENMPRDVVEIDNQTYSKLLTGQENGKRITGDEFGNPILTEQEKAKEPNP